KKKILREGGCGENFELKNPVGQEKWLFSCRIRCRCCGAFGLHRGLSYDSFRLEDRSIYCSSHDSTYDRCEPKQPRLGDCPPPRQKALGPCCGRGLPIDSLPESRSDESASSPIRSR